jgi:predicted ATPase
MIGKARLVTITGLPGVGKSAAAMTAARTVRGRFPDGVFMISLDALQDEVLLPHTIAAALLLPDTFTSSPLAELVSYLRDKQLLLLLDTCEHVLGSVALAAAAIGQSCPGVHILATSREPLRVPGEETLAVEPLPEDDGLELLTRNIQTMQVSDRAALRLVTRKLDSLPLALTMAARELDGTAGTESPDALLARLADGYDFLTDPEAPVARHRSLAAAIGWSHQLCTPAERLLWARAAVFDEPFCVAACQEVCVNTHLSPLDIATGVSLLAERSLLLPQPGDPPKYLMPSTIRGYGLNMLRRLAEEDEMRTRYRRWRAGPRQDPCWQLARPAGGANGA